MTSAVHKHFVLKRGFPIKSFPFRTKKFITSPRLLLEKQDRQTHFSFAPSIYKGLLFVCKGIAYFRNNKSSHYPITCYFIFSFGSPCVRRVRRIRSSPFHLFSPCSPNSSCISSQDRWRSSTNATLKVSFTCTRQGQVLGPLQIFLIYWFIERERMQRGFFFLFFFFQFFFYFDFLIPH